jgi:Holliday junction resolvase
MSGGRKSREKGNRVERQVVGMMRAAGFASEGIPLSGAAGGSFTGDITTSLLGVGRKIEVKCRADGFAQIYRWLANNYALVIKRDRDDPLVVMRLSDALDIANVAESAKDQSPVSGLNRNNQP